MIFLHSHKKEYFSAKLKAILRGDQTGGNRSGSRLMSSKDPKAERANNNRTLNC